MNNEMKRYQKNQTITNEQLQFIKDNVDCLTMKEISERLNVNMYKLIHNMRLLGIEKMPPKKKQAPVVEMNGYFTHDKYYCF